MKTKLLTLFLCSISLLSFAQRGILSETISVSFNNNSLSEAFEIIEKISDAEFAFSPDFLPPTRISKDFKNKKIRTVLNNILNETKLVFKTRGNRITIFKKDENSTDYYEPEIPKFTINGFLRDSASGEELIGGTIRILPENRGTATNAYGFYSITLPEGKYTFEIGYIGYKTIREEINLVSNKLVSFDLTQVKTDLDEVIVTAEKDGDGILFGEAGTNKINLQDLQNLPSLLGERDVLGTMQLLPGVQATGEGNAGFSVRGGSSDQNMILLDEAPIYNPAHMLGIFSIFNPDAIKDVRLMKSHIPTAYRGRLSSVVDIHMKEGNSKDFKFGGGVGLLLTKLKAEGPFADQKGSFMIAGRRTYHDLWMRPLSDNDFRVFFHDLNAKANFRLTEKDRLYVSLYLGDDVFRTREDFEIKWGNTTSTLRWNHLFNDKVFSNTTFIISDFDFDSSTDMAGLLDVEKQAPDFLLRTRVRDYHLKQTFHYYPNPENSFQFGINVIHHTFIPGKLLDENLEPTGGETSNRFAAEYSLFFAHDWQINDSWHIDYGIHLSNFSVLGGDDYIYNYDGEGNRIDSTFYNRWELIKNYFGLEPRISISNQLNPNSKISLSYFHTIQYLQLLPSAFINNPASTWFPSSHIIQPQRAHQISFSYRHEFQNKAWESTFELFGKYMKHQIAYRQGAALELGSDIESQLVFGEARVYGAEFLIKKRSGDLRGWLSLSYSKAENQFNNINSGEFFPSEFDRPLGISLVGIYEASPKFTVAATWNFASGKAVTVPNGKYQIGDQIVNVYGERNNFRMSDFHRLDVAFRWYVKKKNKKGRRYWSVAIHNVYARKNASFVYVQDSQLISLESEGKAWEFSLLPFALPSFTYYFEF